MQKIIVSIATLLTLVISGCSSTSSVTPPLTTPTPRCKDNVCVQEAIVVVDDQMINAVFLITDQTGKVDANNPPQLSAELISSSVYQAGSDGVEKKIFGITQSGHEYYCMTGNQIVLFPEKLVTACGFSAPQTLAPQKIQSGDIVRVALNEFNFEQVVSVREQPKLVSSDTTKPNIVKAYLFADTQGELSVTTFASTQRQIRLIVVVANATRDTKVKVEWIAVNVGDAVPANTKFAEHEYPSDGQNPAVYAFNLGLPSSGVWPIGKYKADIYLDGTFDRTLEFTIQ